jgi:photosystem II stability/assembly factor-like uncharacterized protein
LRGARAIVLISGALAATVLAGAIFIRPTVSESTRTPAYETTDFVAYDFVTMSSGWAVFVSLKPNSNFGRFAIFYTADGARHWKQQLTMPRTFYRFPSIGIDFVDSDSGVVVGGSPLGLYRTGDRGTHWQRISRTNDDVFLASFADRLDGWFLGWGAPSPNQWLQLYTTIDGGSSWSRLADPPNDSGNIAFRNRFDGWLGSATSGAPHVYNSSDGGRTWDRVDLPIPERDLSTNSASESTVRLLPGAGVLVSVTIDGALRYEFASAQRDSPWRQLRGPLNTINDVGSLGFENSHNWWLFNKGILFKSRDAGQTWASIPGGRLEGQYSIRVVDSENAWAQVAFPGNEPGPGLTGLAFTHDGGRSWNRAAVPGLG